jgi:hypothetical protein
VTTTERNRPDEQPLHVCLRLFVSYEDTEGRELALSAKRIFEHEKHRAWVWCVDATSGAYTHEEISDQIRGCDRMTYICTPTSHGSRGQRYERAQALTWDKVIDVIAFDLSHISGEIRHANASIVELNGFDRACAALAMKLAKSPMHSENQAMAVDEKTPLKVEAVGFDQSLAAEVRN